MYRYSFDSQAAIKSDTSERISEKGAYDGVFTLVQGKTSQKGTRGIEFNFKSFNDQEAKYLTLWTHNAAGEIIFGFNVFQSLLTCVGLSDVSTEVVQIMAYDPNIGQEAPKQVHAFKQLMNIPVGVLLAVEEYENKHGMIAEKMVLKGFYNQQNKKTASEIIKNEPAKKLEEKIKGLRDKRLEKQDAYQAQSEANNQTFSARGSMKDQLEPQSNKMDDLEDDIPF